MISTIHPTAIESASAGAAITVCLIIFLVVRELADSGGRLAMVRLSTHLGVFAVPLTVVFAVVFIVWALRIIY